MNTINVPVNHHHLRHSALCGVNRHALANAADANPPRLLGAIKPQQPQPPTRPLSYQRWFRPHAA